MQLDPRIALEAIILNRLEKKMESANRALSKPWTLSISMGSARVNPGEQSTLEELMKLADDRLLEQKRRNKQSAPC